MALVKKNKKTLSTAGRSGASGSSGAEISPRRPYHFEQLAPCMDGCPQGTNIRGILMKIAQAEKYEKPIEEALDEAWLELTEKNPLPSICGRVCPHPCEDNCNRGEKDGALAINNVERFIGDWGIERGLKLPVTDTEAKPEKIAVIGSGPAGLSCAYHLAKKGYKVKIFEALGGPGGMLRYGIPAYRLPRDVIDNEVNRIKELGVEIEYNVSIGKDKPYEELQKDYEAIFVGVGAQGGVKLRCSGEDAENVYSGVRFLRLANTGEPVDIGDNVVVIGGGDTAIDAARVSKRQGAKVTILYRRTRDEMPAIEEEIVGAEEEGIEFHYLAAPVEIIKDGDRAVKMLCQRMELGEPDDSGRRRPVPIEGDIFEIPVSCVIAAISQKPDMVGLEEVANEYNWMTANDNGATDKTGVYTGGDVLELGLVTVAIYQGRRAADTIHNRFRGIEESKEEKQSVIHSERILLDYYAQALRHENLHLGAEERLTDGDKEIATTLELDEVIEEARRCMSCGSCFDCGTCWSYCQDNAIHKPMIAGERYTFKMEFCKGCDKCKEVCPCGFIEMK
ncbi:NAD(P)-binding protein [Calditrichota bacterium]